MCVALEEANRLPLNNVHFTHRNLYAIYDVRCAEQSSGDLIEIRCAFIDASVTRTTYTHTFTDTFIQSH